MVSRKEQELIGQRGGCLFDGKCYFKSGLKCFSSKPCNSRAGGSNASKRKKAPE